MRDDGSRPASSPRASACHTLAARRRCRRCWSRFRRERRRARHEAPLISTLRHAAPIFNALLLFITMPCSFPHSCIHSFIHSFHSFIHVRTRTSIICTSSCPTARLLYAHVPCSFISIYIHVHVLMYFIHVLIHAHVVQPLVLSAHAETFQHRHRLRCFGDMNKKCRRSQQECRRHIVTSFHRSGGRKWQRPAFGLGHQRPAHVCRRRFFITPRQSRQTDDR